MPRRTNAFQELIYLIHHQLSGTAQVSESRMLVDRDTGDEREVDVVIEVLTGKYVFTIGVECRDHDRPAMVDWVESAHSKHRSLTNKLVLVSSSGFTSGAKKKAERLGIETLDLNDATARNWKEKINEIGILHIGRYSYRAAEFTAILRESEGDIAKYYVDVETIIFSRGNVWHSVRELIEEMLDTESIRKVFARIVGDNEDGE